MKLQAEGRAGSNMQELISKVRVLDHGSKHRADQFERLLKWHADEGDDLPIYLIVKKIPKLFVVSTLLLELLLLAVAPEPHIKRAVARALAILGENESLRRERLACSKARLYIRSMGGGDMKGLAIIKISEVISQLEDGKEGTRWIFACGIIGEVWDDGMIDSKNWTNYRNVD
ncbi:hypothetical protein M5K25_017742 [Dendrobium thyrsiflorum]|uniref:Uncharacterized protein n=1 Tax=Dendrobium thyrsiflorum TaxID=117978 RepID=A0ABD0UNT5_DENTH